ncbi:hypothetical protein [Okeania sp. SIO1I7]|uniref:hypothetical protein n=1 Tax=Okeania sp. SIO1I7 TaxID=2607772 RepID=UPI0013F9E5BB|nr:hypothetical protein [Okeania sp. SIO1I7]NET26659.1 hypothetical protein [Okeania sp. SIO1I7]
MYDPKENVFASHLLSREDNLKALKRIAKHLQESGLFVLSIVNFKAYMNTELKSGVIYYPKAERKTENGQEYLDINISFEKNGEIVDRQNLKLLPKNYGLKPPLLRG